MKSHGRDPGLYRRTGCHPRPSDRTPGQPQSTHTIGMIVIWFVLLRLPQRRWVVAVRDSGLVSTDKGRGRGGAPHCWLASTAYHDRAIQLGAHTALFHSLPGAALAATDRPRGRVDEYLDFTYVAYYGSPPLLGVALDLHGAAARVRYESSATVLVMLLRGATSALSGLRSGDRVVSQPHLTSHRPKNSSSSPWRTVSQSGRRQRVPRFRARTSAVAVLTPAAGLAVRPARVLVRAATACAALGTGVWGLHLRGARRGRAAGRRGGLTSRRRTSTGSWAVTCRSRGLGRYQGG